MSHTYLIGIGGTGLSAIAQVLLERGEQVSGSDRNMSPRTQSLMDNGADVQIGHAAENIKAPDIVLRSSAVPDDNPEVVTALKKGIPVVKRVDYLGDFLINQRVVGIAGSHGKTTTSAMTAWTLSELGVEPGFIVGGEVSNLNANAAAGSGDVFVIEADEYDFMFWGLAPQIGVITNIEHDHPDCFPTEDDFMQAFFGYVERIKPEGKLVICLDDPGAIMALGHARMKGIDTVTYSSRSTKADIYAVDLQPQTGAGYRFTAKRANEHWVDVALDVPGLHNVQNALAVLAVVSELYLDVKQAAKALAQFSGAGRRFDIRGEVNDVLVVDDYGHHPTEIKATLQATRARYPDRRIWAVWQPHTYSRTLLKLADFAVSFTDADRVIVTPVFAAREEAPEDYEHGTVIASIEQPLAAAVIDLPHATSYLLNAVRPGDVVITFSAGDANQISIDLLAGLNIQEQINAQ